MVTAREIGNMLLKLAGETGDLLTNLKLQKLVYYAQAWHLAVYKKSLFKEDFQAWVHGPVIPSLYASFKQFGWNPITSSSSGRKLPSLPAQSLRLVKEVYEKYGCFEASQLERLTHSERPWREARGNLDFDAPCSKIISKESMKEFYSGLIKS